MASGFDELIERLLEDVALSGSQGLSDKEIIRTAKAFYVDGDKQNSQEGETNEADLLFSDEPPTAPSIVVDESLVNALWEWLSKHHDINVIDAQQDQADCADATVQTEDANALTISTEAGVIGSRSRANNDSNASIRAGKRLVTTEDKAWQAIAGHGVDFNRIPRLEFQCLQVIAAQGPNGILQPDLTRITGQDKRSLPKRTDQLATKGYITKTRVLASKAQTTLLKLKRYAQFDQSSHAPLPKTDTSNELQNVSDKQVIYYDKWWDTIVGLIRSQPDHIIAYKDLRLELRVHGRNEYTKALHRCVRRLAAAGFLKRLSAAILDEKGNPTGKTIRCLKMLREPTDLDRLAFRIGNGRRHRWENVEKENFQDRGEAEIDIADNDDDDDDADEVLEGRDINTFDDRTLPQWTIDKPYPNFIFDLVDNAGPQGISSMDLGSRAMGPLWRRPLDEVMAKFTDVWQSSQLPHLRHLTIVRDTAIHNKFAHYVYRSYENFKKAVQNGEAVWEAVTIGTSLGKKAKKSPFNPQVEAELDEWGFLKQDAAQFESSEGLATLTQSRKSVQREDATNDDDAPTEPSHSSSVQAAVGDLDPSPASPSLLGARRRNQVARPSPSQTPIVRKKERVVSKKDQEEFKQWAHITAEKLGIIEPKVRQTQDPFSSAKRLRRSITNPNQGNGQEGRFVEPLAERIATIEAELLAKSRPGVYINPPGARHAKMDLSIQIGRPRQACIAVFKSSLLAQLPWFRDDTASVEPPVIGTDQTPSNATRRIPRAQEVSENPDTMDDPADEPDSEGCVVEVDGDRLSRLSRLQANVVPSASRTMPALTKHNPAQPTSVPPAQASEDAASRTTILSEYQAPGEVDNQTAAFNAVEHTPPALLTRRSSARSGKQYRSSIPSTSTPLAFATSHPMTTFQDSSNASQQITTSSPDVSVPKRRGRPTKAMVAERKRLQKEAENAASLKVASNLELPSTDCAASKPYAEDSVPGRASAPVSKCQTQGSRQDTYATQSESAPNDTQDILTFSNENEATAVADISMPIENGQNSKQSASHATPALEIVGPDHGVATDSRNDHVGGLMSLPKRTVVDGDGKGSSIHEGGRTNNPVGNPNVETAGSEAHEIDPESVSLLETVHNVESPATAKTPRKFGTTRDRGVIFHLRTKIAMDIIKQCNGVYPGNREIWYPFVTAWERIYNQHPDRHTIDRAIKGLVDNGKLKKLTFSFKTRKGIMKMASILTLPGINPDSPEVQRCLQRMKDAFPASYIPPAADVSEELRRRPANHPVASGRKTRKSTWVNEDGEVTHTPPRHYSRDEFPVIEGVVVRRTGAALDAAEREAQRLGYDNAAQRKRDENRARQKKFYNKRRPKPSKRDYRDSETPDADGTDYDEVSEEQTAMQGVIQLDGYIHNPEDAVIQRHNGRGKLSRVVRLDDGFDPSLKRRIALRHQEINSMRMPAAVLALTQLKMPYLPSIKAHSMLNSEWLVDALKRNPGPLVQPTFDNTMPAQIRALLMSPGTLTLAASGTIGTNGSLRTLSDIGSHDALRPRKKQPLRVESLSNALPFWQNAQPSMFDGPAALSSELLSLRVGDQHRRKGREGRVSECQLGSIANVLPSTLRSMPEELDEILERATGLGHAPASNSEGPMHRFYTDIDRVKAWEIDFLNTTPTWDHERNDRWPFINHVLNQGQASPEIDEEHLAFERRQLTSAAKSLTVTDDIPVLYALNDELSALFAKHGRSLPPAIPQVAAQRSEARPALYRSMDPDASPWRKLSRVEKGESQPFHAKRAWSSVEEAVLIELFADPDFWNKPEEQRVKEFQNITGTPRTWKGLHQHYRMYVGDLPAGTRPTRESEQQASSVKRGLKRSAPSAFEDIENGTGLLDDEAGSTPYLTHLRPVRQTSQFRLMPRTLEHRPEPQHVEGQQGIVMYDVSNEGQQPGRPPAYTQSDGPRIDPALSSSHRRSIQGPSESSSKTVATENGVAGTKQLRKFKSRKRPATLERDENDASVSLDPLLTRTPPLKKVKRLNRKIPHGVSQSEQERLFAAVAIVLTLTGGVRQLNPNWDLLSHATSFKYEPQFLKQRWASLRKSKIEDLDRLQERIREKFLAQYESSSLLPINFQDLSNTDWPALVDWVETEVLLRTQTSAQSQKEVLDLVVPRSELELQYSIVEPVDAFGPSYENYFTGATDILRSSTALSVIHGNALPVSMNSRCNDEESLMLPKSWFRAVVVTEDSKYDAEAAAKKMCAFSEVSFSKAQNELIAEQIIHQVRAGRLMPGRNFDITSSMWRQFVRWPRPDASYLREVAAARSTILAKFERQDSISLDFRTEDADMLVITNMIAQGLLKIGTDLPERKDDVNAPWPKLSIWGYTDFDYDTKQYDRSRLRFPVSYKKTESFTFQHGLKVARIPTQALQLEREIGSRIPLWIDIHENFIDSLWDMVVRSILHVIVFRPGSTANAISQAHKGKLWVWEIEIVLNWMERSRIVVKFGAGGEKARIWKGGWRTSEWWYCAFSPDIATWKAPEEDARMDTEGSRMPTRSSVRVQETA